jgi:PAS domain S-box-containing protein
MIDSHVDKGSGDAEQQGTAKQSERELRHMLDSIPVIAWRAGPNGYVQHLNKRWFDYTGMTAEQARGRGWKSAVHPDDIDQLVDIGRAYVAAGEAIDGAARLRRFDGVYRWFLFRPAPARDDAGNVIGWYGSIIDIEDRKRAEEKALEAECNLKLIIDTIPALTWSARTDGTAEFFSEHYLNYVGLSLEQAQDWGWAQAVHPDDMGSLARAWQAVLASGAPGEAEARLRRADGEYRWFLFRVNPLRDEHGNIVKWYGVNTDIEDRKRTEQELRRAYIHLEDAQRLSHTGSFSSSLLADDHVWSDELYRLFELDPSTKITLRAFRAMIHPDDLASFDEAFWRSRADGSDFDEVFRILPASGNIKYLHVVAHRTEDAAGRPAFAGAMQDVTASKLAEEQLRRSEAFLAKGQEMSSSGTFSFRSATGEFTWSDQLYRIYEFEPGSDVTFELITTRYHPEDRHVIETVREQTRNGVTDFDYEHRLLMSDGSIKFVHVVAHGSPDKDGNGLEYFGAIQDMTQRRLAEDALDKVRRELARVTRAMSLGALTASIAHEVNQPLAGIITNAGTCLRMLAADPPNIEGARETARRTIRDGNRAADVVTRLRALFDKKADATETFDLNQATQEVLALMWGDLLRNKVILRTELDQDHPLFVTGDRVQLQQVIQNLVRNATDAMCDVTDRPRDLQVAASRDGGHARVVVRDAGVGFEPQAAERLFDAFYTSKSDGMGVGLSISRSIIENHGGKLWAETNEGHGATFSFSIPGMAEDGTGEPPGGASCSPGLSVSKAR